MKINSIVNTVNKIIDEKQNQDSDSKNVKHPNLDNIVKTSEKNLFNYDIEVFIDDINSFNEKIDIILNHLK